MNNTNQNENVNLEEAATASVESSKDNEQKDFEVEIVECFDDMKIRDELLRGIYGYGFEKPSEFQGKVLMSLLKGRDVIGESYAGTGKTASYAISILQRLDLSVSACQALVLVPARELAQGIRLVISSVAEYFNPNPKCEAIVGGTNLKESITKLQQGVQIAVGTPGRVHDMINRKALDVSNLKTLVFDECDEMLARGFKDQIEDILKLLPTDVQVVLLSSTIPPEVLELKNKFMRNPVHIIVKRIEPTFEGIRQFYVSIDKVEWKLETLIDLYDVLSISQSIVYCNTKKAVDFLKEQFEAKEIRASKMHGDMTMQERDEAYREFRSGATRVIIVHDFLASNIDSTLASFIINYELPSSNEKYIMRIGSRSRFRPRQIAINFITGDEEKTRMREIEAYYQLKIEELPENVSDLV